MIQNIEFEVKFDKNHNKLPFSMVFTDLDTCLIDTSKILLNVHDPKLHFLNVFLMIFMVTLSVKSRSCAGKRNGFLEINNKTDLLGR